MPCRTKQRRKALRLSLGSVSRRQPGTVVRAGAACGGGTRRRQEAPLPALLRLGQDGTARSGWPHGSVEGRGPPTPFGDRLRVQAVAGGQITGRRLGLLELGSNSR